LGLPGVASAAILVFIFAWNEFLYALTFTVTEASRTIPVGIALFPGIHELPWGEIAAASVIVTLPLVVLVLALQRRIVAGLTAGALKG
jgi:multiple sugar transport system permease protein